MKPYVYIYFDPSRTVKPFYVGKGTGRRYKRHLSRKDHHPMTYKLRAMKNNGIKPLVVQIGCDTDEMALEMEKGLIRCIGRRNDGTGPLLNVAEGGIQPPSALGKKRAPMSVQHRAKLSEARKEAWQKPEYREHMIGAHTGKKQSAETVNKRVAANVGRKNSEETKQKMRIARIKYYEARK